jgi:protein-tyrosine sulfotransferase
MVEANGANLVFLLSTPRAGSTLLGAVLGNHSEVFCPNEPWLLLGLHALTQEKPPIPASTNHELAAIALGQLLSREEFINASRAFALSVYNSKLRHSGKAIFVDKTPRYALVLPFLDALFPAAKKIWLQRNPLDVAASFASTWSIPVAELVGEILTVNSFDLTLGLCNYVNYFRGRSNTFALRYEDFVAEPSRLTAAICGFLNLDPEPEMERYAPNEGALSGMKDQLMGDKNIFAHSRPHPSSINRWRDAMGLADIQKMVDYLGRAPFEQMGYEQTIQEVEALGVRFPSATEVEARLQYLRQRSITQHQEPERPSPSAPNMEKNWWLKLGEGLGVLRPSTASRPSP